MRPKIGLPSSGGNEELFEPKLIDVAPTPFLAGLDGTSDRMLRRPEMPDGVLVVGRVAAADVSALHAHSELQPRVVHQEAIVAARTARLDDANAVDVRTRHWIFRHHHDGGKVRTRCLAVESNDAMRFMPQID